MDEMQALHDKNQVGTRQKILPQLRKAFRPTHLIALAIGVAIGNWVTLDAAIRLAATHYEQGIQHGHMRLHARNFAVQAGATSDEVPRVVAAIITLGRSDMAAAERCLGELRAKAL